MACRRETSRPSCGRPGPRVARALTLVELIVVIGIIGLVALLTLPSMFSVFTSGAEAQAYNLFSAQLAATRAEAIQTANYVGLHAQLADAVNNAGQPLYPDLADVCFTAMVELKNFRRGDIPGAYLDTEEAARGADEMVARFERINDTPIRMPGNMTLGELQSTYVSGNGVYKALDDPGFTAFTVVFSPTGAVTRQVQGKNVRFYHNSPLFTGGTRLWNLDVAHNNDHPRGEPGAAAVTMFDYAEFAQKDWEVEDGVDTEHRVEYLNENGAFLTVNVYTGHLNKRK